MLETLSFSALPDEVGQRIDKVIFNKLDGVLTRSHIQKLFDENCVTVNLESKNKNYKLKLNDNVCVLIPSPKEINIEPENIELDIRYEDDDVLVVNKPKGMVVHPANGNYSGTLVNALLFHCKDSLSGINGQIRPGIVHRIDKDTSGLLLVAKNDFAHVSLSNQIKDHSCNRQYQAVCYGNFKEQDGIINLPIGRSQIDRKKMAVTDKNSKNAVTHYEVIESFDGFSHLGLRLETGRTHQIRVHMAYVGHPLCGDEVYGPKKCIKELHGQCLHAKTIGFVHPRTNERIEIDSELPEYFQKFLRGLKKYE